jgi:hypothetical protein
MTNVTPITLKSGGHRNVEAGLCFNEAAAFLAGEPHSAAPQCVSPVIQRFGMALNDRLDDQRRQLLRPYVYRALGTAGDGCDDERRRMCTEWLIEQLPPIYDRAGMPGAAEKIRGLSGDLAVENVLRVLREVRNEAWDARQAAFGTLRATVKQRMREELKKRGIEKPDADADAVADTAADVVADAAADADAVADTAADVVADAAADADADTAADVVADAAAVAAALADALALAAADAVADALALAAALAVAVAAAAADLTVGLPDYWKIRDKVYPIAYKAAKAKADEIYGPLSDERLASALDLFSRMLPAAPLIVPAVANADLLCAVNEVPA